MNRLELIRGDTLNLKFQRKDEFDEIIKEKPDKMYFTVKSSYYSKEVVFQKSLNDGSIIYNEEDSCYYTTINPEDTKDLKYGDDYVFDIEIITGDTVKTIAKGILEIQEEVTFAENEV